MFGVLQADPQWISQDTAAGLRLAMVNVNWSSWEPSPGTFDQKYAQQISGIARTYHRAGWEVAVDIGLQSPPDWVLSLPGGRLTDQYGNRSSSADFEFSQAVREAASAYMAVVVRTVPDVEYFRVGLSDSGETLYPSVVRNGWWAFGRSAQGQASGLPPGVDATPLPGWVPGHQTYRDQRLPLVRVQEWYDWYFGAMANALAWEISSYRAAGFHGQLQLVMPGMGATPSLYSYRLSHYLAPAPEHDAYDTMNTAAVWWRLLDALPDLKGAVVDVSSVADASGQPRANSCQPSDAKVDYHTNLTIENWSDTRWLSYLARRHGLPVIGENPGNTPESDLGAVLNLVRTCHLAALQWAFDYQLHEFGHYVDVNQLGAAIGQYRST